MHFTGWLYTSEYILNPDGTADRIRWLYTSERVAPIERNIQRHHDPIINSFVLVVRLDRNGNSIISRLSNGPIEAMNRKAKDLKRLGRGYRNFDHLRNRFLYATRLDPELNGREQVKQDGPHALRYHSSVLRSRQRVLNSELESILEKYDCSKEELLALRHWVSEGNSPYENPDGIYNEAGMTCDFIAASRIIDAAFDEIDNICIFRSVRPMCTEFEVHYNVI